MPIVIICILLFLIFEFRKSPISSDKKHNKWTEQNSEINDDFDLIDPNLSDYTGKYQKKLLLTKNEWYEYRKLKQLAENKGLQVCPKVRLLDLIEPRRGDPKYKTHFYKIQAKHVDFVICDQNLYVKAILELDDNSHNQAERKKRDEFVDQILKDVGYTVIRTCSITESTLNEIH